MSFAALALNIVCFQLLYKPKAVHIEKPAEFKMKQKNLLQNCLKTVL